MTKPSLRMIPAADSSSEQSLPRSWLARVPGVFGLVSRAGGMVWLSPRWAARLGDDRDATSLLDLVDVRETASLAAWLAAGGGDGQTGAFHARLRSPGLGQVRFEASVEGSDLLVCATDVSSAPDPALRESEERFAAFMRYFPGIAFMKQRNGGYVFVSQQGKRLFPESGPTYGPRYDILSAEALQQIQYADAAVFDRGEVVESVIEVNEGNSVRQWLSVRFPLPDALGNRSLLGGISLDVTDHRRTQSALTRSDARFRELIEAFPAAVCVHRNELLLYINPALARLLGYSDASTLLGQSIRDAVHPDDRASQAERYAAIKKTGRRQPRIEQRWRKHDGTYAVIEVESLPCDFDGEPAVMSVAHDITEQREMQRRLIQAERLAAVGALAAGVAHEVNNPLAYVLLNLDAVRNELRKLGNVVGEQSAFAKPLASMATKLTLACEGADQVRVIVRDLRTFSRADDEQRVPTDVASVIDASITVAGSEIRRRGRLYRNYAEVPLVLANESRLGQVFLNLLVNAAHALPENTPAEQSIYVSLRHDLQSNEVVVDVRNTGKGIPPEILGRIFDPFFTTKSAGGGAGLGLSICHGIITSFGGRIAVTSTSDEGTTFCVRLPAAPAT